MDEKTAKAAGEILRHQAITDAKTLGSGSIGEANAVRIAAGAEDTSRARCFPAPWTDDDPGVNALGAFVVALGLTVPGLCERTARYAFGPVADFMALTDSALERQEKRLGWLEAARGRMLMAPAHLDDGVTEALEAMRFDDPRTALKATKDALKTVAGPVAVGRLLAIHASNLREVDELAEAVFALAMAIPALDVADDALGMGRALLGAATVVRACGSFELSRCLVDEAERWYVKTGSMTGRALAMALRAILVRRAGDSRAALCELGASLSLFTPGDRLFAASTHQLRAVFLLDCGDVPGARDAIAKASAAVPHARVLRGRIAWCAGNIETARGNDAGAERLYREAFDLISEPICDRLQVLDQAERAATRQRETARTAKRKRLGLRENNFRHSGAVLSKLLLHLGWENLPIVS